MSRPRLTLFAADYDGPSLEPCTARELVGELVELGASVRVVTLELPSSPRDSAGRRMEGGVEVLRCPPLTRGFGALRRGRVLAETRLGAALRLEDTVEFVAEPIPSVMVFRPILASSARELLLAVGPGNALAKKLLEEASDPLVFVSPRAPAPGHDRLASAALAVLTSAALGPSWSAACPERRVVAGAAAAHARFCVEEWRRRFG